MGESTGKAYFEDCRVGDRVVSPGRTITEADLVLFAGYTGDWLPLHTDAEYAKGTPFGERIAHGMLVLVVGSALLMRLGEARFLPKSTIALYEMEKVRFRTPARIGDTIRLECEVDSVRQLDKRRGLISAHGLIRNQRGEVVVSWSMKALAGRRPNGGEA